MSDCIERALARARDRRLAPRAASVLAAAALAIGLAPFAATSARADEDAPPPEADDVQVEETTLLDDPAQGVVALRELGAELPVAADRNDLDPGELRSLLLEDSTVWLDVRGLVQFIEPAPTSAVVQQAQADSNADAPIPLEAPLARSFALHSKPGSTRKIFLDFDGAKVGGSGWAADYAVAASQPGWDPAGDGAAFSSGERQQLQRVWAMVAEDFAAYDVDVTTHDPGADALVKSSSSDNRYGARVLISPSVNAFKHVCDSHCAGAAYRGFFGLADYQSAWVFPHALGDDPKLIAEAASHEIGHSLGLKHDGLGDQEYHSGSDGWAPIMGSGYHQPITQWSRGEYSGATNKENDLALIGKFLRRRTDESSPSMPVVLSTSTGYITSASDIDVVRLGKCPAGARVHVSPAAISPDLDLSATLRDASGKVRASSAPTTQRIDRERATGMDAAVRVPGAGKGWQITIRGAASSSVGYSSYASIGAYSLTATGCDGAAAGVPSAARAITATPDPEQPRVTVKWSPPKRPGAGPITGYTVRVSGAGSDADRKYLLPARARRKTIAGLAPGIEYDVMVNAVNKRGAGSAAALNVVTARSATSVPTAPRSVSGRWDDSTHRAEIFWARPADDGGLRITGYRITLASGSTETLPAGDLDAALSEIRTPGKYVASLQAVNAAGASAPVRVVVVVPPRPANDDLGRAQPITGSSGRIEGDTTGASGASDDPRGPGGRAAGGRSVWYSWKARRDGIARFATGSASPTRDTTLAVFTGRRSGLTRRAANDDAGGSLLSAVRLPVSAGTTYRIMVDGPATSGGVGAFDLTWVFGRAPGRVARPRLTKVARGIAVRWTAPKDGGSKVTGYRVRVSGQPARALRSGARRSAYRGLAPGRYRVRVTARNVLGASRASVAATVRLR